MMESKGRKAGFQISPLIGLMNGWCGLQSNITCTCMCVLPHAHNRTLTREYTSHARVFTLSFLAGARSRRLLTHAHACSRLSERAWFSGYAVYAHLIKRMLVSLKELVVEHLLYTCGINQVMYLLSHKMDRFFFSFCFLLLSWGEMRALKLIATTKPRVSSSRFVTLRPGNYG